MLDNRLSGVLLHPTSLPSKYGIGDLGKEAFAFVDFLSNSNQKIWQMLPLGPVGYAESPYQSFSAFAGNHMLIDLEELVDNGLLEKSDLEIDYSFTERRIDFPKVIEFKNRLLKKAFDKFIEDEDYQKFLLDNDYWIEDYALFMALKEHYNLVAWNLWDKKIAFRKRFAIKKYKKILKRQIKYQEFLQFTFDRQWHILKSYANDKGIYIIGDLPIFISYDSADAWSKPHLFELDKHGNPTKVAGVPPDYFSKTGQLWGNPHYKWEEMEKHDYFWWTERFKFLFKMVDYVRIDHFRGFEAYWEIDGKAKTAMEGKWVKAPGDKLFAKVKEVIGDLPIIAEDLGLITPEVDELKEKFNFPGMKILQFAYGGAIEERFLPVNYEERSVVYTGTHDNDTTLGWFNKLKETDDSFIDNLMKNLNIKGNITGEEAVWKLIETAFTSNSIIAIIPMQDFLLEDSEHRMNIPGTIGGNWLYRLSNDYAKDELASRIRELTKLSKRNEA